MFKVYFMILLGGIVGMLFGRSLLTLEADFSFFSFFYKYIRKENFELIRHRYGRCFLFIGFISLFTSILSIFMELLAFTLSHYSIYEFICIINLFISIICFLFLIFMLFLFIFNTIIKLKLPKEYKFLLCTFLILMIVFNI